ncbi:MAG: His/Gly/Thr/Pro-type tRNA ligase C-terminal domain-containing protein [Arenicellales bacterium]
MEVLLDDRKERPGIMFADMELIGIPHRITIGDRVLERGVVEYVHRASGDKQEFAVDDALESLQKILG